MNLFDASGSRWRPEFLLEGRSYQVALHLLGTSSGDPCQITLLETGRPSPAMGFIVSCQTAPAWHRVLTGAEADCQSKMMPRHGGFYSYWWAANGEAQPLRSWSDKAVGGVEYWFALHINPFATGAFFKKNSTRITNRPDCS